MQRIFVCLAVLACALLARPASSDPAQKTAPGKDWTPWVKDINTNTLGSLNSGGPWTVLDGVAYFWASDVHGEELWRSDGSPDGTWLVKDIIPGPESSYPRYLTAWNGALWFTALVESNRTALFKSDGTSDGTVVIKDGFFGYPNLAAGLLAGLADTLMFAANDGTNGLELWKSDGTAEGTVLLKDIAPGSAGSFPRLFTQVGSLVLFRAGDTNGTELWRSDGTPNGTFLLSDIEPGPRSSNPDSFTSLGTNLLFTARNSTELWLSDGTAGGTVRLHSFPTISPVSTVSFLSLVGTQVFFQATVSGYREVWRSDGTADGTRLVAPIAPAGNYPYYFVDLNGIALFGATYGSGYELWRSDGTQQGTWPVVGTNGSPIPNPGALAPAGDRVYFVASSANIGYELWQTDGTSNNTYLVKDIAPGPASSFPVVGATLGSVTLFMASTPELGSELWRTDGTEAGTFLVKDINRITAGSYPSLSALVGNTLFFSVDPGALWKTDGSSAATTLVKQMRDGVSPQNPRITAMAPLNNSLLFSSSAQDSTNGTELWISDGTGVGTHLLKDIFPGSGSSSPRNFTQLGNYLLFTATSLNGLELWRTDGTEEGTIEVKDLRPGPDGSSPSAFTVYHGALFFNAYHGTNRGGLWRSDGTSTGTTLVLELTNSPFGALAVAADQLLLFYSFGTNGGLWSSRGTPETTSFVTLVNPVTSLVAGPSFLVSGTPDSALFTSGDENTGYELWRTDGTPAGTRLLKDINPGPASSNPRAFFNAGRLTYFQADDGIHGVEIWCTDGTEAGTHLLKDINPGPLSSVSYVPTVRMAEVNGLVFFWAYDPQHGTELWMTDGTEPGTSPIAELNPGKSSVSIPSQPPVLQAARDRLYFAADDGSTGYELWTVVVPPRPLLVSTAANFGLLLQATGEIEIVNRF